MSSLKKGATSLGTSEILRVAVERETKRRSFSLTKVPPRYVPSTLENSRVDHSRTVHLEFPELSAYSASIAPISDGSFVSNTTLVPGLTQLTARSIPIITGGYKTTDGVRRRAANSF